MWILHFVKQTLSQAPRTPVDRSTFWKYKAAIWLYFCLWLGLGVFLWVQWHELSPFLSWPLAAIEGIFAPDLSIFRRLFEGHRTRSKRSLDGEF
jgi:hypothetical protein